MTDIGFPGLARQGSRRRATPTLAHGPRSRAVRSLLEIAELRAELHELLDAALTRARKRRDRPLVHLLEAAAITGCDIGGEVDAAGQALGQIATLWSDGGGSA